MTTPRSGLDRRSNINRRQMILEFETDRRRIERRELGERRGKWVRSSQWSSIDLSLRNRYFWAIINKGR